MQRSVSLQVQTQQLLCFGGESWLVAVVLTTVGVEMPCINKNEGLVSYRTPHHPKPELILLSVCLGYLLRGPYPLQLPHNSNTGWHPTAAVS